ncbi:uncharacterized protein LOC126794663 [Argentina anserina]|uniref:uncharacterized protein LOC126794663 n=1 Tax=Argentina anserina TaxID=57926 RepID=UPI00217623AE|nr:uncharacterized protein LOC126794663 [Potentilla anserina]
MSSTPKKRSKPKPRPPSDSLSSSIPSLLEPPQSLFPTKTELLSLFAVLAIATSVALTFNFLYSALFNPRSSPFCDGPDSSLDFVSDSCEACPSHGRCREGELECDQGYTKRGKLCVEDGVIQDTATKLSETVEMRLCKAYAEFLCYGTGTIWVEQNDIWSDLDKSELAEDVGLDNAIYMYAKQRAIEMISRLLDGRTNSLGVKEFKCPEVLAEHYKPSSCRIRQWISEHALLIFPVCASLLGFTLLLWKFHQRQYLSARVDEVYQQICEELEEKALMNRENNKSEPWVVASALRDSLLSLKERKNPVLWKKVEELVREDSRVDRYPTLVKGESKVVWEWQVEGSLSSSRKRRKGEASKLKSSRGTERSPDQLLYSLEADRRQLDLESMMLRQ